MHVGKLKEELFRLITNSRGRRTSATSQYLLGNISILDGGPPSYMSIPNLEVVFFEVAVGGVPLEIWKIEQYHNPQVVSAGQRNVLLRNIFAYLKISEMHTDTQEMDPYVSVVAADHLPNLRDEQWQKIVWSLDGFVSIQLYSNLLWKRHLDDEIAKSAKQQQAEDEREKMSVPPATSSSHRGENFVGSVRSVKSGSLPTPPLAPQPAPVVVGSFGSLKTGTSPGWFPSVSHFVPPELQLAPSTLEGAALRPLIDVPFSPAQVKQQRSHRPEVPPLFALVGNDEVEETAEARVHSIMNLCDRDGTTIDLPDTDARELLEQLLATFRSQQPSL